MATRDTYEVQTWEDAPIETSPLSAARFNHIEQGIKDASDNRALKEVYGDNSINLGRIAGTNVGEGSATAGYYLSVSGNYSFGEGFGTTVSGNNSHGEGNGVTVSGNNSHGEGRGTIAQGDNQHVSGKYNVADSNKSVIVGGGESYQRKNIYTLDWQGNAMYAGTVESQGLILTDQATEQKYKITVENGNIEITETE